MSDKREGELLASAPRISGPFFKDESHYLTAEGYPLGTTCWWYLVELAGRRMVFAADEAQDAWRKARLSSSRFSSRPAPT